MPGLLLVTPFASMAEVAATHYPWLPVRLLMHSKFDAIGKIVRYHGPLLQSHGTADTIVPFKFGRRLFEAANEPKQFVEIPRGEHNESPGRRYYAEVAKFLDSLPSLDGGRGEEKTGKGEEGRKGGTE